MRRIKYPFSPLLHFSSSSSCFSTICYSLNPPPFFKYEQGCVAAVLNPSEVHVFPDFPCAQAFSCQSHRWPRQRHPALPSICGRFLISLALVLPVTPTAAAAPPDSSEPVAEEAAAGTTGAPEAAEPPAAGSSSERFAAAGDSDSDAAALREAAKTGSPADTAGAAGLAATEGAAVVVIPAASSNRCPRSPNA